MAEDTKTTKRTFENVTDGPKGINLPNGQTYMVPKGATVEAEITDAEANSAARTKWFKIDGGKFKGAEATAWEKPQVAPVTVVETAKEGEEAPKEPPKA